MTRRLVRLSRIMAELTDAELRDELLAHGQTVGPITDTTRAIYRKKLNHLKAAEKKAGKGRGKAAVARKPAPVFSSDDSEGEGSAAPAKGRKTRSGRGRGRAAAKPAAPPPSPPRRVLPSPRRSLRRSMVSEPEPEQDSSDGEDAGPVRSPITADQSTSRLSSSFFNTSRSRPARPTMASAALQVSMNNTMNLSRFDQPDSLQLSDSDFDDGDNDVVPSVPSPITATRGRGGGETQVSPKSDDDSSFFTRTWSRWMGTSSGGVNDRSEGRIPEPRSTSTPETGRLLRHRVRQTPTPTASVTPRHSTRSGAARHGAGFTLNNAAGSNHHAPRGGRDPDDTALLSEDEMEKEFQTEEDATFSDYALHVSKVLVVVVTLFFLGLAAVYIVMSGGPVDSRENLWLEGGKTKDGYMPQQVENAREMIRDMYDVLSAKAGEFECGTAGENTHTVEFLSQRYRTRYGAEFGFGTSSAYSLEIALRHVAKNPHWAIRMLDGSGSETEDPRSTRLLRSEAPSLSLWCRVMRSAARVLYWLCLVLTAVAAMALVATFVRWRKRQKDEEARRVYELIEKIIDILKSHSDLCAMRDQEPILAIPHVRDMLIPPKERRRMQGLWDRAVRFLSANESRLRVETQKISGEEFEVWRWLPSCANGGKVWQGQAFGENRDSRLNSPITSPTNCLKIRNMFDAAVECEDRWEVKIQDAILEKCPRDAGILHVAVDKSSQEGCVYVKCMSNEHAGRCYQAMHGWWFDGKLVTVKYIRLERYHERFPGARHATRPMAPSNSERRSLAQPFHRSIIESS